VGFNNKGGTGNKTCIDLINPPINGYNYTITPGTAYTPAASDWRHTYSGAATQNEGHSQQLPNGNMLITMSLSGYMYEIDSNQTVVWSKTISGTVTNARRYTACYVNGAATVAATASQSQVCAGAAVQLTATPSGGSGNTYSWTSLPAGFTSTLQNPVVTPSETTSYFVTLTNGTCSSNDSVTIGVDPIPDTPTISLTGDSLMSSSSTGNQWYKDGTIIQGATGQYLVLTGPASYQVQVTGPTGCTSAMSSPLVWVSIGETLKGNAISVYPNPTTGKIMLTMNGLENKLFEVEIFNMLGKRVFSAKNQLSFDISHMDAGLYYLTLLSDGMEYSGKKIILIK
jgi:hypothetical protein